VSNQCEDGIGGAANTKPASWNRPPNFLLVDFYNQGSTNGSVFEVAAQANNVTYDRECCGRAKSLAAALLQPSATYLGLIVAVAAALMV
jgi:hypothetical protein